MKPDSSLPVDEEICETDIAVIGMAGRFPGADSLEQFQENLRQGVESITFFESDQLLRAGQERDVIEHERYVKARAILSDVEGFDAELFGMNPREAALLDPQHRLFLESVWELFERAGYDPATLKGTVGVFAGSGINTYYLNNLLGRSGQVGADGFQMMLHSDKDYLATRVSYLFNLTGPSLAIQTACSTSLVAIHVACQNLLNGECDMAIAGAASVQTPQVAGYLYEDGMIHSPDGRCRPFDAQAGGTITGSGVGAVLLRRATDAIVSRDRIVALIKGSAINNDGRDKVGYTAPSSSGQQRVVAEALAVAGVDPTGISYIEAHGTGTPLGDPIEVSALRRVFGSCPAASIGLGSVKANVGHLDTAAGVAGFIKTVLALQHGIMPPHPNFAAANPKTALEDSPFHVPTTAREWRRNGQPRRAGVSSFGIGGTNAHLVVAEAPARAPSQAPQRPWQVIPFSANTEAALRSRLSSARQDFDGLGGRGLADAAYTLSVGRTALSWRAAWTLDSDCGLKRSGEGPPHIQFSETPPEIVFLFPGQGEQRLGMAKGVAAVEPAFRREVEGCLRHLDNSIRPGVERILWGGSDGAAEDELWQTQYAQPALFILEYSLARLWMSWGVRPTAMIGHSLGEYVAACLAEVFTLPDALALVSKRGRLMESLPAGSMLAVGLPRAEADEFAVDGVSLAAENGAELCVLSGPSDRIHRLAENLSAKGIHTRPLAATRAFHSEMMEPVLQPYDEAVRDVPKQQPRIPFISNVTGDWINGEALDPSYWTRHIRETVRFAPGLRQVLDGERRLLLEVGPGAVLSTLARRHPDWREDHQTLASLPIDQASGAVQPRGMCDALAGLWRAGASLDWQQYHADEERNRVSLSCYPFERQRHWVDPVDTSASARQAEESRPERNDLKDWFYAPSWRRSYPSRVKVSDDAGCLVFGEKELAKAVAKALGAQDASTFVSCGEGFARDADGWQVDGLNPADYRRLFQELKESQGLPNRIIHAWNVERPSIQRAGSADHWDAFRRCFHELLYLWRGLREIDPSGEFQFTLLTPGIMSVVGETELDTDCLAALGPARVLGVEDDRTQWQVIDLAEACPPSGQIGDLASWIAAEIAKPSPDEPLVAFRQGYRWTPSFDRLRLDTDASVGRIDPEAVYLITGGLGGVGITLANKLAELGARKLVLTTRSEWREEDRNSSRMDAVKQLRDRSIEVRVLRADVTDLKSMAAAVEEIEKTFGIIKGVAHAAGLPGGGLASARGAEEMDAVLEPKVLGTMALAEIFASRQLDFLVFCSSLTALVGDLGQVDYCAANAFLDGFAHRLRQRGCPAVSVNWDTWRDVGMAVDSRLPEYLLRLREATAEFAISPADGGQAFAAILQDCPPQVAITPCDLEARLQNNGSGLLAALEQLDATPTRTVQRKRRNDEYAAPTNDTESRIQQIWEKLLGFSEIGINDDFFALGGDSLIATQVSSRLRDEFDVAVEAGLVFTAPTIAGMAEVILARQLESVDPDELETLLQELDECELEDALTGAGGAHGT